MQFQNIDINIDIEICLLEILIPILILKKMHIGIDIGKIGPTFFRFLRKFYSWVTQPLQNKFY